MYIFGYTFLDSFNKSFSLPLNALDASKKLINMEELWFLYLAIISLRAYKHMSVPSIDLQPNWLFIVLTNWWVVTAQWIRHMPLV